MDDYKKGFADGFKEGWEAALKQQSKTYHPSEMKPTPYELGAPWDPTCRVCGLKGVMGYVCPRSDCPTRVTC